MADSRALRRWLVFVASLRLLSVYLGIFHPEKIAENVFDLQQNQVTDLYGRTFATWTFLTCCLCIICSRNPQNRPIYVATLMSFVAAFVHFLTELLIFETISLKRAYIPLAISAISAMWMTGGINYYTAEKDETKRHEE